MKTIGALLLVLAVGCGPAHLHLQGPGNFNINTPWGVSVTGTLEADGFLEYDPKEPSPRLEEARALARRGAP